MKCHRLVLLVCLLMLMNFGGIAHASGDLGAFENVIGEYVLRNTEIGAGLVGRITGIASDEVSDVAYRSFMQRIGWGQSRALRGELSQDLAQIRSDFSAYRQSKGRSPELSDGEQLLPDEADFLRNASSALRSSRIDNLVTESLTFVRVHTARAGAGGGSFNESAGAFLEGGDGHSEDGAAGNGGAAAGHSAEGEVPSLPTAAAAADAAAGETVDLDSLNMHWWQKIAMRFRAYRGFFRAFRISEGDARTILGVSGRRFTAADLATIQKYNRLLDSLNEYARMRLVIKSFAQERPVIYSRLNELTADATRQYMEGAISAERYISLRKAAGKDLQLNDIVWEAERRMLDTIERCRDLAGREAGGQFQSGPISISEQNLRNFQGNIERVTQAIRDNTARLGELRRQGAADQADALQRQILRDTADRDLWRERLDLESRNLQKMYVDFYENYNNLELFLNLRNGHINSEAVQRFDMPDPFVVQSAELNGWGEISDRALFNSTHELVLNESRLFFRSQAGATRQFVRDMNQMTEKYFGKRFTETELGQEFKQYSDNLAIVTFKRVLTALGIPSATAISAEYGPKVAERVWHAMFGDPSSSSSSGGSHSSSSSDQGSSDDDSGGGSDGGSADNGGANGSDGHADAPDAGTARHGLPHGGFVGHPSS